MLMERFVPAYTESINLLDYSAVVIPVTRADQEIDLPDPTYQALSEKDQKNWEACKMVSLFLPALLALVLFHLPFAYLSPIKSTIDDAKTYHGAPVGVQIVGRKHEEEKVWAIACIVERILSEAGYGFKL